MALFNYANREITAKVVYYGPGVCGKTTSLQYIHERIAPAQRGRLLSLATETDRTIFFDLLPLKLGEIKGFKLRFQLYTVPGQVKYNKTRKLVLQGADAVVFFADSQVNRREANIESFKNLQENLEEQGKRLEDIPLVYEYNKRDMDTILSIEQLNQDLNPRNLPHFATIALQGVGVMETLESISKLALQSMEHRLSSSGDDATQAEPEEDEELLMMDDDGLLDLTAGEDMSEEMLGFSEEELDSLKMESDLTLGTDEDLSLESKPIGYDKNINVEEFEIEPDSVAQTGTLKESEFFALKDIEEQALQELEDFIQGAEDESGLTTEEFPSLADDNLDELDFGADMGAPAPLSFDEESPPLSPAELEEANEDLLAFDLGGDTNEEAELSLSLDEDEGAEEEALAFELDSQDSRLEFTGDTPEKEDEDVLAFDLSDDESAPLSFEEENDFTAAGPVFDDNSFTASPSFDDDEGFTAVNLGEEDLEEGAGSDGEEMKTDIETLDISDNVLNWDNDEVSSAEEAELPAFNLGDEEEDERSESTPLNAGEDDLMEFNLDDDEFASFEPTSPVEESARSDIEPLDLSDSELGLSFDQDIDQHSKAEEHVEPQEEEEEPFDFEITDSVRFEMQPGEEISHVTPFEHQLDQLSEDVFTTEEEEGEDTFEPDLSEAEETESFQSISDEWTRLVVLSKYFFNSGEQHRAQHTVNGNVQAALMYYFAIETGLKAVASKYETCNPAVATLRIIFESIEEETSKPVAGTRSVMDKVVKLKDKIQLETVYPDDEECEMAARICERFLGELAQNFLTIDFSKLSPVLAKPE